MTSLPGTDHQQALLQTIVDRYHADTRVGALLVFGSLGRDDWDARSDLDLAVILNQGAEIPVNDEIEAVSDALLRSGQPVLFTQVVGEDGYLLLRSLTGIAIRYHPLQTVEAGVLDGMRVLCGAMPVDAILDAARANAQEPLAPVHELHRMLWLALDADIKLQRRQFWNALPTLNRMRDALVAIFAVARGGRRAYRFFEAEASIQLKTALGRTLPHYAPEDPTASIRAQSAALMRLLQVIDEHLDELSNGQLALGEGEAEVLERLHDRQQSLLAAL